MKVHRYDKAFLIVGGVLLVGCLFALLYASVGMGIHLPGRHATIDPQAVHTTPPFDNPGVRQLPDGRVEAVVVGQIWSFVPAEIRLPLGKEIVFTVTSADVIHGFHIDGTRVNMMMIPGQISRNTYTFRRPGEYLLVCHEYCGAAHHTMAGKVIVE